LANNAASQKHPLISHASFSVFQKLRGTESGTGRAFFCDMAHIFRLMARIQALSFCALLGASGVFAATPQFQVAAPELVEAVSNDIVRVDEFRFIRKEARKMGVKVYLFGGTAAAFAHYVKWNLQRLKGDPRYQGDRFDYDYTNIFRSTQDLDIVVDGSAEQVHSLQQKLESEFKYFIGSKTQWEVRSLRHPLGSPGTPGFKEALLDDWDFLNQNSDSHSTGMIELSESPDSTVRDLRDWDSPAPIFLKDVLSSKLHYYFAKGHFKTLRAKSGINPPIISVIRYLTKAFQYELSMDPQDLAIIQKIVDDFEPQRDLQNPVVRSWFERNVPKLYQHAVNLEYAAHTLQGLKLKEKLISAGNPAQIDSMAWWINRMPLESKPVGKGPGKTAQELGIDVVAHDTKSFLAYESITRAHTGDPNVFISRYGFDGESATSGDGFYTLNGRAGLWGTKITIRFRVNPQAREGWDFKQNGGSVIFLNKGAFRVIPESLNLGIYQYFELLRDDKNMTADDKGLLEKFHRRMQHRLKFMDASELQKIRGLVMDELKKDVPNSHIISEWINFGFDDPRDDILSEYSRRFLQNPNAVTFENWIKILDGSKQEHLPDEIAKNLLLAAEKLSRGWSGSPHHWTTKNFQKFSQLTIAIIDRNFIDNSDENFKFLLEHTRPYRSDRMTASIIFNGIRGLNQWRRVEWLIDEAKSKEKIPTANFFYQWALNEVAEHVIAPIQDPTIKALYIQKLWDMTKGADFQSIAAQALLRFGFKDCGESCDPFFLELLPHVKIENSDFMKELVRGFPEKRFIAEPKLYKALFHRLLSSRYENVLFLGGTLLENEASPASEDDLVLFIDTLSSTRNWDVLRNLPHVLSAQKWSDLSSYYLKKTYEALPSAGSSDRYEFLKNILYYYGYFSQPWNLDKTDLYRYFLHEGVKGLRMVNDASSLLERIADFPENMRKQRLQLVVEEYAKDPEQFSVLCKTIQEMTHHVRFEGWTNITLPLPDREWDRVLDMANHLKAGDIPKFFKKCPAFKGARPLGLFTCENLMKILFWSPE